MYLFALILHYYDLLLFIGVDVNRVIDRGVFLGKSALCWVTSVFFPEDEIEPLNYMHLF